ncbi:PorP/SprF family type IX secretion system membrane protein [Mangrovibacterium diazotrophicum]|uniref:Type IX secretion system PorP/SprF family membrane protein n=1 Tax=Mangrovibacterium diazotrophicum TaxID=1261403 RepID=A0A419WAK6_9BACT|nr:PorP/SprF family type IX secretion system membrane protein [Mangrovibacterium diazotrophicum]RKD92498.1 type IX secretion system PorP/SprF family membrane protein [Mangrovibacterium diazotrophicum]
MKKILLLSVGLLFLTIQSVFAQTELGMTSHWYNRANYNPASIARAGFIYFFSNYRNQWTGIDGAPEIYNLNASGFYEEYHSAFGISMLRDDIGLTTALNPTLQYAYQLKLDRDLFLSLGLAVGVYTRSVNTSAYEAVIIDDPALDYTSERYSSPDASLGFELQAEYFIVGASTTHLFALWKSDDELLISNHRYFYAYYKNTEKEAYNLTAGIQLSNRSNLTVVEGTGIIRFKRPTGLVKGPTELFDLGATYRTSNELTLLCGINISRNIRIGYTYDFNLGSELKSNPSHEFLIEYRIPLRRYRNTDFIWYN